MKIDVFTNTKYNTEDNSAFLLFRKEHPKREAWEKKDKKIKKDSGTYTYTNTIDNEETIKIIKNALEIGQDIYLD